jgi:signal transduction histidine kinase
MESQTLEKLINVSRLLAEQRVLAPLLEQAMAVALGLLNGEYGYIILLTPDGTLDFRVRQDWRGNQLAHPEEQVSRTIFDQVIARCQPLLTADAAIDPGLQNSESVLNLGLRSVVCVPLIAHGKVLGALYLENRSNREIFEVEDLKVLEYFAASLAVAIENAQLNDELEQRVAQRTIELNEVNQELEAFSYSVSHDLKAPLRAIHAYGKLLARDHEEQLDANGNELLGKMLVSTRQMNEKIDSLLILSRMTRNELNWKSIDLGKLAAQVIETLHAGDPERVITCRVAPGLKTQGDPAMIRNLLENLFGNAWKYSAKNPKAQIEVGSENKDGEIIFFVKDNGAGFNMRYADKLFVPFQRLHATTEYQGHGIGLATVQRIVRRHKGRIWAEAEEDKGATFYFTLGRP